MTYISAKDAYRDIHESLANAVLSMLEDCNYVEAIKYADMMQELEKDKVEMLTCYDVKAGVIREYIND